MSSKRPEWLEEYRRRTAFIEVVDMAFDEEVSDKNVREALMKAAEDMGELFMPPSTPSTPKKRRGSRRG